MPIAELYSFLDLDTADRPHHLRLTDGIEHYGGPWALHTLGGAGGKTIAGAIQTGTHEGDVGQRGYGYSPSLTHS